MPSLQVREIPQPLYQRLMEDARRAHRSLAQQAVVTLETALAEDGAPKARRRRLIEKILSRQRSFDTHSLTDPAELVRQDRDGR